jgi:hypothetical protein
MLAQPARRVKRRLRMIPARRRSRPEPHGQTPRRRRPLRDRPSMNQTNGPVGLRHPGCRRADGPVRPRRPDVPASRWPGRTLTARDATEQTVRSDDDRPTCHETRDPPDYDRPACHRAEGPVGQRQPRMSRTGRLCPTTTDPRARDGTALSDDDRPACRRPGGAVGPRPPPYRRAGDPVASRQTQLPGHRSLCPTATASHAQARAVRTPYVPFTPTTTSRFAL